MVLFGLRDRGSVNASLPVIKILKERGILVSIYAQGPANDFLKDEFLSISEIEFNNLLGSKRPLTLVVGTAHKGGIFSPVDLISKAKKYNLPVVLIEDIWASHSAFKWDVLPDCVCVMDEFAKKLILQTWSNYPELRVHVTGSPVFDKFSGLVTELSQQKLRKCLDLSEKWPIVFFPGQVWGMPQAVSMLVDALNSLDSPAYLILRDHPSIIHHDSPDEFKKIYLNYQKTLENLRAGRIIDVGNFASDEIIAGSDIVVGMYSTMTVEACYLRKPVLIISNTETNQTLLGATNGVLSEWPIISLGASLKAENVGEIKGCLHKMLVGDTVAMLQAQHKHFQADGLSADRVAKVICSYYKS